MTPYIPSFIDGPVTPDNVTRWVEKISQIAGDDEAAHGCEDELHQAVLQAIANNQCDEPQRCATIALQTLDIGFARWCA